ncbi:MAG: bifunctional DNA-formamidopyrimidine glycosylase/DNA-(apurinic or apyrimidinic site) lyase [Rhodospirillales bacterium]|nr:bifunctional DNA-formamidopyrimidine glycosylase/DNA-(apurinic or apyrimidinic site) lyase [Rhodospirillales bacterium]
MPELPEVETVVRGLRPRLVGRRLVRLVQRRADLRAPLPRGLASRTEGRRVVAVERRAKYILIRLAARRGRDAGGDAGENILIIHLGMTGHLVFMADPPPPAGPHDHLDFTFDDGTLLRFTDPRRFGVVDLMPAAALARDRRFASLGPEPLAPEFTPAVLEAVLAGRRGPIKAALLDQRLVAGIGNIYACEALFAAGISPRRAAGTVRGPRAAALTVAIRDVLNRAIAAGGSSLRDYVQASGELGWFQMQWGVYDREGQPCPGCDCGRPGRPGAIRRIVQSGRSTFYCAKRQR